MDARQIGAGGDTSPSVCAPAGVRGVDEAGAVEVVLAADGLPALIQPLACWARVAREGRAGNAVGAAFAAAHRAHVVATAAEAAGAAEMLVRRPPSREPGASRPADAWRSARDLLEYADHVMAGPGPAVGIGRSAAASVTITLARPGTLRCTVDGQWAAAVDSAQAAAALAEALAAARRELGIAVADRASAAAALDELAAAMIEQLDALRARR